MAGRAYAINREQAKVAANVVEGTILVDNRLAIALFDPASTHSFVAPVFSYDFTVATPLGKGVVCELYIP